MQLHAVYICSLLVSDRNHCLSQSCLTHLLTINNMDEMIKSILIKFMGNTKLGVSVDLLDSGKALQRNRYRPDGWAEAK